jgi:hypothetical protein
MDAMMVLVGEREERRKIAHGQVCFFFFGVFSFGVFFFPFYCVLVYTIFCALVYTQEHDGLSMTVDVDMD